MVHIKRVYAKPSIHDGVRILVDRVWPRGLSKKEASIAEWQKEVAPTASLRKWFGHDPARWSEFRKRYRAELKHLGHHHALEGMAHHSRHGTITLVYAAADEEHNQAVVLKEWLEEMKQSPQ